MKNARGIAATKTVGVVIAATAASLMATAGPAYAATGISPAPTKHHHRHHDNGNGGNSLQVPIQACGNNVGNNIGVGAFGHGSAKGGNNKSKCSQKTTSR